MGVEDRVERIVLDPAVRARIMADRAEFLGELPKTVPAIPPSPQPTLPRLFGDYELLEEVARGGMGVVYKARQGKDGKVVALKMMLAGEHAPPDEIRRFRGEAEKVKQLRHVNIVPIYDVGECDGRPFFTMKLVEGGSLAADPCAAPFRESKAAAALMATVARAVHYAHQRFTMHRDIKPANILLTAGGTPYVTDFGLAKRVGGDSTLTQTGAIVGTPSYMPPEQAEGKLSDLTWASDVYALGATLYHLLTCQPPFSGGNPVEVLRKVIDEDPRPPRSLVPDLSRDLEAVCLKCLEKNPNHRYANAEALAVDLENYLAGRPVAARRAGVGHRLVKWGKRRPYLAAAYLVGLVALACTPFAYVYCADRWNIWGSAVVQAILDRYERSPSRPAPSEGELKKAAAEQRREIWTELHARSLTKDGWRPLSTPPTDREREDSDAWTQFQVMTALIGAPEADTADARPFVQVLNKLFDGKADGFPSPFQKGYGWPFLHDDYPSGETNAWAVSTLAKALHTRRPLAQHERERMLVHLGDVQIALEEYRAREANYATGAWTLFPNQKDPSLSNFYVTTLMCHALLDLRRAGLPWRGDEGKRDELLAGTVKALQDQFDGRGWYTNSHHFQRSLNDGLTLQIFSALLRAEAEAGFELAPGVLDQIPRQLEECGVLRGDEEDPQGVFRPAFTDKRGGVPKEVMGIERRIVTLRQPWALDCSVRWLRRAEQKGAPHEEVVRTRRVLKHLLVDLRDARLHRAKTDARYFAAETLIGLTAFDGD